MACTAPRHCRLLSVVDIELTFLERTRNMAGSVDGISPQWSLPISSWRGTCIEDGRRRSCLSLVVGRRDFVVLVGSGGLGAVCVIHLVMGGWFGCCGSIVVGCFEAAAVFRLV